MAGAGAAGGAGATTPGSMAGNAAGFDRHGTPRVVRVGADRSRIPGSRKAHALAGSLAAVAALAATTASAIRGISRRPDDAGIRRSVALPARVTPAAPEARTASVTPAPAVGVAARAAPTEDPRAVHTKANHVWIRARPDWDSRWVGILRHGRSVALATGRPVPGRGCAAWYAILPDGFVCVDGKRATLDATDPEWIRVAARAVDTTVPTPHRYAESAGVERYWTLPSPEEQQAREHDLQRHLRLVERARRGEARDASLERVDLALATETAVDIGRLPIELQVQRTRLGGGSTLAYVGDYRHGERSFLLTSDLAWVPKDRVRPYAPVDFEGVELGDAVRLPLAFFREHTRRGFRRDASGHFMTGDLHYPRLAWTPLTGREETDGGVTFLETRSDGWWVRKDDAVVPRAAERPPWGAPGEPPPRGRATWIDASVHEGWLVAYEGITPVFATLVAGGRGGARPVREAVYPTSATPIGRFRVTEKLVTATMDARDGQTHEEVPWVQNFHGAHAIHSAYWHDAWGELVSGGCLNVSPRDGRRLFRFTEPEVPAGWQGIRWDPARSASTYVVVHR